MLGIPYSSVAKASKQSSACKTRPAALQKLFSREGEKCQGSLCCCCCCKDTGRNFPSASQAGARLPHAKLTTLCTIPTTKGSFPTHRRRSCSGSTREVPCNGTGNTNQMLLGKTCPWWELPRSKDTPREHFASTTSLQEPQSLRTASKRTAQNPGLCQLLAAAANAGSSRLRWHRLCA